MGFSKIVKTLAGDASVLTRPRRRGRSALGAIVLCVILSASGFAARLSVDTAFVWKETLGPEFLEVSVRVAPETYLYENEVKVTVTDASGAAIAATTTPQAVEGESFGSRVRMYPAGDHAWRFPLSGKFPLTSRVAYQGCAKKPAVCFLPKSYEKTFGAPEKPFVATAKPPAPTATGSAPRSGVAALDRLLVRGGFWIFFAAFVGGVLSCFTPCVLPLIPITLAVLGAGAGTRRRQAFKRATAYVLGIVLTFTALAAIAAMTGGALASWLFGSPVFLWLFAVILGALALSMLGLYDLALPTGLQSRVNAIGGGKSNFDAALMGMVAGFVALPCAGPVLAWLLLLAAASGNVFFGGGLLMAYAFGFGAPFLAVGAGAVKLPKSGPYMELIKSFLGTAVAVVAVYFLIFASAPLAAATREGGMAAKAASLALIVLGALFGAFHADGHSTRKSVRAMKILGAFMIAFGVVWNLRVSSDNAPETSGWMTVDRALTLAAQTDKPILLDYTAEWCLACKELESVTFADPDVRAELSAAWTLAKLDGTRETDAVVAIKKRFDIQNPPTLLLLSPKGEVLRRIYGFIGPRPFLEALRETRNAAAGPWIGRLPDPVFRAPKD